MIFALALAVAALPDVLREATAPPIHPTNLILKSELSAEAQLRGGRITREMPEIGYCVASFPVKTKDAMYEDMVAKHGSEDVCLDFRKQLAYNPNDPLSGGAWHFNSIQARQAWDEGFGSPIVVAVLDTGVNTAHPDLTSNLWVNAGETVNGVDDDANGFVDDVNGYDFGYNDGLPNDVNGHGTACAGLVAATMDNNLGNCGVAPRAKIMAIKASLDNGYFYDSSTIPSYIYAANNGAKIFSMSYFADGVSAAEKVAMDYAVSQGVLPMAAAGNDATNLNYYPASYTNVVAVAALGNSTTRAAFSNFGSGVDVATPGVSLRTTTANGDYTNSFAGTSGACPVAAGAAALIWGHNPSLTAAQVRAILEDTSTGLTSNLGEFSNYGRVNALLGVRVAKGLASQPNRTPVVRWISPYFPLEGVSRIYGRGFGGSNTVSVTQGSTNLAVVNKTRDYIDVRNGPRVSPSTLTVRVNGVSVMQTPRPTLGSTMFPLCELTARENATAIYPHFPATLAVDRSALETTLSTGYRLEGNFRRVVAGAKMNLHLTRQYLGTGSGTEVVQIYNWSTGSYPYGSFVTLGSSNVSGGTTLQDAFTIPNPANMIDPEGAVILRISGSVTGDLRVRLDQVALVSR